MKTPFLCLSNLGKPCGLSSDPGAMTQRSCAYFGARYLLGPIREALHLVHGPVGCLYHGAMVRGKRTICAGTALETEAIIFGGLERLKKAFEEALSLSPGVSGAFLYTTCVSGLIGEDVKGLARELGRRFGLPVIALDCPGFSSPSQAGGHEMAYRALLELVESAPKANEPTVNLLGEYNVAQEALVIKKLLSRLGLKVYTVITGQTTIREIRTMTRAWLNLLICGSTARRFAEELKSRFGLPYLKVSFYGLSATSRSLQRISETLGLDQKKTERLIQREERRVQEAARAFSLPRPYRALIVLGAGRLGPLSRLLRELGGEVLAAASVFGQEEDHQEAVPYVDFLTDDPGDDEFETLLRLLKPDLVLTNARERWRTTKLGFPTIAFPQEDRLGPFTAYEGWLNFAHLLSQTLRAPVWKLKKSSL